MSDELRFDALLMSPVRLGVISVLMTRKHATFSDLRQLLELTQGNLTIHLQKIEQAAYIKIKKEFVKKRPRTTLSITAKGRSAFLRHLEILNSIPDQDD